MPHSRRIAVTEDRRRSTQRILTFPALAALSASCLAVLTAGPAAASTAQSVINASLNDVSCPSAADCMAVGWFLGQIPGTGSFQNLTLAEQWSGAAWQRRATPTPGSSGGLAGVACTSPAACLAGRAAGQGFADTP
jgi:hypothetical protein